MADDQSPDFEIWGQAIDALSAVVKLFANGTLKLPADKTILDRLTQAERAARPRAYKSARPRQPPQGPMTIPEKVPGAALLVGRGPLPAIKELDAIEPVIGKAVKSLPPDQAKTLGEAYDVARSLVRTEQPSRGLVRRPQVAPPLPEGHRKMNDVLNTIALTAAGTAAGNELPNAIHLIKQVIETRGHL